jgi:hypothetical protein
MSVMPSRDRPLIHFGQPSRGRAHAELRPTHSIWSDRPDNPAANTEDAKFIGNAVKELLAA